MSTSWSSCTTPMAPSTRTSPGAPASPARKPASIRRTSPRQSCDSSRSIDADATAAASGLPMNVGPWARTGTSPLLMPSATRSVHSAAAMVRYPPVMALPTHITSGLTFAWSAANSSPVRPNPVAISSNTSSTSLASVSSRSTCR